MADEQRPHPEPVPTEAAESPSATEPCHDDAISRRMLEFHRALTHMRSRRFSAAPGSSFPAVHHRHRTPQHVHGGYEVVMVGIVRGGILTWHVNGEPPVVAGDGDAYVNGGFGGVPASEEAIAALPETTARGESSEVMGEGDRECAVCLGAYQTGDAVRTMPCSHGFHERCIFPWLRVSRLCPLCRFALPAAEAFADDDDDDYGDSEEEDDDVDNDDTL